MSVNTIILQREPHSQVCPCSVLVGICCPFALFHSFHPSIPSSSVSFVSIRAYCQIQHILIQA